MIGGYRECLWCGEEIEEGRSDKIYCDKLCYNHFKNLEYRNAYEPIKKSFEAYKNSHRALSSLVKKFGSGAKVKLSKAVQMGLNRKSPCLLIYLKNRDGAFSQIGSIAYQVSSDLMYIQIHIISDGRGN